MASKKHYPKGLDGRMRDQDGEIREKRGDTHISSIEQEFGRDFGVRSDMRLDTFFERKKLGSLSEALKKRK